ncbi:MAG TPA: prefoldin subunit beta [Thermoplasmata archaeon]|nr:prefoldin subunit beta [Thermoplasmata archaeon]
MAIPAKLQNDLKLRETVHTLDEMRALADDTPIYRPVGGLLVKAKGKTEVIDLLTEEKETLEVRLKAMERQEGHLKEKYTQMQKELTEALDKAGLVATGPAGADAETGES